MDDAQHFRSRAQVCLREAQAATLQHVRDRRITAARSFVSLAERRERVSGRALH